MDKNYYWQLNGRRKSKYLLNFHDGVSTHKDGSEFYDLRIFSNKKKMEKFIKELSRNGYQER